MSEGVRVQKILFLANSFGEDCTAYMENITPRLFVRNLYVPACSLEQHSEFIKKRAEVYQYQKDAVMIGDKPVSANAVSYTHLDVYKRQILDLVENSSAKKAKSEQFITCLLYTSKLFRRHSRSSTLRRKRTWSPELRIGCRTTFFPLYSSGSVFSAWLQSWSCWL